MKNRVQEAYNAAFTGEFLRLTEGFKPGASARRKTGVTIVAKPPASFAAPSPRVGAVGSGKATANYGGDNTVYRPPEPPTPTKAKLKRAPVKRWDGKTKRPMQSGLRHSKGMMDGDGGGCDCGCDKKVQEAKRFGGQMIGGGKRRIAKGSGLGKGPRKVKVGKGGLRSSMPFVPNGAKLNSPAPWRRTPRIVV